MNVTNKNNKDKIKRTYISLATLGNSNVGKTNIINNFLGLQFTDKNISTIGIDFKIKNVILENNSKLKVKIWDTAGQERFRSMAFNFLKNIQGILLIYDLTDESSFISIDRWINNLENKLDIKNVPIILVGNKNDKEDERKISYEKGLKYAQKYNFKFFEMSAKTGENVNKAFLTLIHLYYDKNKEEFILENVKENIKEDEKNNNKEELQHFMQENKLLNEEIKGLREQLSIQAKELIDLNSFEKEIVKLKAENEILTNENKEINTKLEEHKKKEEQELLEKKKTELIKAIKSLKKTPVLKSQNDKINYEKQIEALKKLKEEEKKDYEEQIKKLKLEIAIIKLHNLKHQRKNDEILNNYKNMVKTASNQSIKKYGFFFICALIILILAIKKF